MRRLFDPPCLAASMKICVISPRYSFTGVALAQARLARALVEDGHDVDLIYGCLDYDLLPTDRRALPLVAGANVRQWGQTKVSRMLPRICSYLRDVRPDVVFSAEDHLNDIVLLAAILTRSKAKISGSSRVFPLDREGHGGPYSVMPLAPRWFFKQLTRLLMRRADALTCVSDDMAAAYRKLFNSDKHVGVHNIIVDKRSRERLNEPVDHPWFTKKDAPIVAAAGTLTLRKGFADLVQAVRHLHDRDRRVRLAIFGEGNLRAELEALVGELGLRNWVWLPGRVENPLKYFAHAEVSVLSSYSEGLPNVLVEAMMCGCTPVATDCPTGPREVLQDGKYGFLIPMHDPKAMANAIEAALDRPVPRERLEEAIASFGERAVLDRHFALLGLDRKN